MNKQETFGELLFPFLESIENSLWEFDLTVKGKPEYPIEAVRAVSKIFASVIMDKMYNLMETENIPLEDRMKMVVKCGDDIRNLIKKETKKF